MQTIESTGKTLDEAIRSGLAALGVERDAVHVEILQNPKTGFLGIGSTLARVKLTPAVTEQAGQPRRPAAPAGNKTSKPPQSAPPRVDTVPKPKQAAPQIRQAAPPREENREAPRPRKQPRPSTPASEEHLKRAEVFVAGLLEHLNMGVTSAVRIECGDVCVKLEGENIGNLIGRRGDTLDAIQHLAAHVVNLGNDEFSVRVHVDAADYRRKRQEALEQLARRMASNAVRYRSNMTLEPMNAYERHIIHVTLQDTPGVSTFSTGSEPRRRVVVAYQRPGRVGRDNRDNRDSRDNRDNRDNRDSRGPAPRRDNRDGRDGSRRGAPRSAAPRSAPPAQSAQPTQPRSLPVKEFGIKKSNQEMTE